MDLQEIIKVQQAKIDELMNQLHGRRLTEQSQIHDLKTRIRSLQKQKINIQGKDNIISQLERKLSILTLRNQDS